MMPVYLFVPLSIFLLYLLYKIYKLLKKNKDVYIAYIKSKDSYLQGVLTSFIVCFFICIIFGFTFIDDSLKDLYSSPMAVGELGKYIGILFVYIIFTPFFLLISSIFCMILYRVLKCRKSQKSCFSIFIISLGCLFLLFLLCLC
jgi:hypothetical protein